MTPRMTDHFDRARTGYRALTGFEAALQAGPLEPKLLHLVKLRASQINGCAFCIQMHVAEALQDGETHLRLHMVAGWRDSPLFSDRERAALAWTEALTLVAQTGAPDADYEAMREAFDEAEAVKLTMLIGAINVWNRLAVGFRSQHPKAWSAAKAAA